MKRLEEIYNECECNKKSEILEAMKKYAEECVKASLEKASESAKFIIDTKNNGEISKTHCYENNDGKIFIDKESITNTENIYLL